MRGAAIMVKRAKCVTAMRASQRRAAVISMAVNQSTRAANPRSDHIIATLKY